MFLLIILTSFQMNTTVLYNFSSAGALDGWFTVNDDVMGGRSTCSFVLNEQGNAIFSGQVSLENNGGFSSVHYRFSPVNTKGYRFLSLQLKGDGKTYQARIKKQASDYYSYIGYFKTSGEWQQVKIPLSDMYPSFRGRILDMPDFNGGEIEEFTLLIGNKKAESFRIEIDKIELLQE